MYWLQKYRNFFDTFAFVQRAETAVPARFNEGFTSNQVFTTESGSNFQISQRLRVLPVDFFQI